MLCTQINCSRCSHDNMCDQKKIVIWTLLTPLCINSFFPRMDSPTFEFEFDQPWAITLSLSAHYAVCQRPRAVARSSLRDSYVLNLACLQSCYAASFSAPSNSLSLFDKQGLQLMTSIISAHSENITLIRSPPYLSTHRGNDVLLSSGKDGLLKVWDIRSQYDCVLQCP